MRHGIARLIDSYAEGLIEKGECAPRVLRLRERVAELEAQVHQLGELAERSTDIEQIIGCLEEFANQIRAGLEAIDWSTRRAIIRALVKVIEVDRDEVYVVFRVGANPFELRPEGGIWKHCWRRVQIAFGEGSMHSSSSRFGNRWDGVWIERHSGPPRTSVYSCRNDTLALCYL